LEGKGMKILLSFLVLFTFIFILSSSLHISLKSEKNLLSPENEGKIDENPKKVIHGTTNPNSEQITTPTDSSSSIKRYKRQDEDGPEDQPILTSEEPQDQDFETTTITTIPTIPTTIPTTLPTTPTTQPTTTTKPTIPTTLPVNFFRNIEHINN
jgi:hypothetical protein